MKKFLALVFISPFLFSCFYGKKNFHYNKVWKRNNNRSNILIGQLSHDIKKIWGINEFPISGPKDHVRYTDFYQTRSHIGFDTGVITVETISETHTIEYLRKTMINTFLMSADLKNFILYYSNSNEIKISHNPFLYGQVVDQTGEPIQKIQQAIDFSNFLLKTRLMICRNSFRIIYSVKINLASNHLDKRANKYMNMIRKASRKYGIDESLILAIMQTESSFNPNAVSRSDALGLMQVTQYAAGKDVFRAKGKPGTPSRRYLLDPNNNIDIGTAYLSLLNNVYLSGIENPTSRRYAVITAYNGGVESVLRVFSRNRIEAKSIINNMMPKDVYTTLVTCHPSAEVRRYLYKVSSAQHKFY